MKSFILRAVKPKKDDIFALFPNDEYLYFYCNSLKDLQQTIRQITPKGYRVRTPAWFSKYLKLNNYDLVLNSGFLIQKETYRIIKSTESKIDYKIFNFTNRENLSYPLKALVSDLAIDNAKKMFN